MTTASAAGKIILFGEHAVVYDRPAVAVPLAQLRAHAQVEESNRAGIVIHARDLGKSYALSAAPRDDAIATLVRLVLTTLHAPPNLALELSIESDIPIASGLGSGAAISTAIVRALAAHLGQPLPPDQVSAFVYESEKVYHGTPSGIDNTVIALEQAIRFSRTEGPRPIHLARPFTLAIANTGIASPTRITVGNVRQEWLAAPARYEELFDAVAAIVNQAQSALERGDTDRLGPLMNQNQALLEEIGVSSGEIETLVHAARAAGASGAKLSGGGRGGNVIIYLVPGQEEEIRPALLRAGATSVIITEVK